MERDGRETAEKKLIAEMKLNSVEFQVTNLFELKMSLEISKKSLEIKKAALCKKIKCYAFSHEASFIIKIVL